MSTLRLDANQIQPHLVEHGNPGQVRETLLMRERVTPQLLDVADEVTTINDLIAFAHDLGATPADVYPLLEGEHFAAMLDFFRFDEDYIVQEQLRDAPASTWDDAYCDGVAERTDWDHIDELTEAGIDAQLGFLAAAYLPVSHAATRLAAVVTDNSAAPPAETGEVCWLPTSHPAYPHP